jgi:hypothetical protein
MEALQMNLIGAVFGGAIEAVWAAIPRALVVVAIWAYLTYKLAGG